MYELHRKFNRKQFPVPNSVSLLGPVHLVAPAFYPPRFSNQ